MCKCNANRTVKR